MILIPSIELRGGDVVAARPEPDSTESEFLADDPISIARALRDQGALFFHLVDGDAVAGVGEQLDVVSAFVDAGLPCAVSGAVSDAARIESLIERGADRIIVDPVFLMNAGEAREVVDRLGARLGVGLDVDGARVLSVGRRPDQLLGLDAVLARVVELGVQRVVHRSAASSSGPDVDSVRAMLAAVDAEVFASAAVRSKSDLESLTSLADSGLAGVVLEDAARALLARAQ